GVERQPVNNVENVARGDARSKSQRNATELAAGAEELLRPRRRDRSALNVSAIIDIQIAQLGVERERGGGVVQPAEQVRRAGAGAGVSAQIRQNKCSAEIQIRIDDRKRAAVMPVVSIEVQ